MPGDDDEEVENGLFVSLVIPEGAVAGVDSLTFQYGDDGGQVSPSKPLHFIKLHSMHRKRGDGVPVSLDSNSNANGVT